MNRIFPLVHCPQLYIQVCSNCLSMGVYPGLFKLFILGPLGHMGFDPRINSLNRPGYTVIINQIFGGFFFMNKQMVKPSGLSALHKPFGLWPHGLYRADNPSGFTTVYSFKKPQIFVVELYPCR